MFNVKPKRILYRIILPFTLLFGITTIVSWILSVYFISSYLDQSLRQQMQQVASAISKSSYLLNPAVLQQVKKVIDAEVVIFDRNDRIISATFSNPSIQARIAEISKSSIKEPLVGRNVEIDGAGYRTIVHPVLLPGPGKAYLSLWMPTAEADRLRTKIILGMGGIALFGILAMGGIGYLIARTITAPVEELVKVTEKVSGGDFNERAHLNGRDEIGRLAASFNNMIDQLKTFEQKLVESEKLATAGQMVAGFAHEIRNPLTSIKMLGQVLYGHLKENPADREMLNSLVKEIDRLDRIIQEMINRTRPGELQRQWEDLNLQVEDVLRVAGKSPIEEQIHIEQNLSGDLPKIYMDSEKLKQVLWNLILNAKEAMSKGGRILVATTKADTQFITLAVEDDGPGIAEAELEQLFQPFFTTKPEGVGLGLTMSRKIVEQHGGTLTLESRPEGGTKALVVLPTQDNLSE